MLLSFQLHGQHKGLQMDEQQVGPGELFLHVWRKILQIKGFISINKMAI